MTKQQPEETGSPAYYTIEEAAAIIKVDRRTIFNWLRDGKLKAVKFGDSWRIPRAAVFPESKSRET